MIIPSRHRAFVGAIAAAAAIGGALVAIHYHRLGLTLSHYDARGHLVVARRVIDSITPGWQQIGAVWLPLPHLLNLLPVQVDALYRSGASAVAISVAAFAVATTAIASIVLAITGSRLAAAAGAAVFALNPNVLYLQATPMTEPLLLALMTSAVAMSIEWCQSVGRNAGLQACPRATADLKVRTTTTRVRATSATVTGVVFALACLTRYDAWPVTVCALAAATWACWRHGDSWLIASRRVGSIARYPAVAILAFLIFSRIVVGQWFVSEGFFVPENKSLGDPLLAFAEIAWGTRMLSGYFTVAIAGAGLIMLLAAGVARTTRAGGIVVLSLLATAALPWAAFLNGHPFRIRYMVPLLAIEAVGAGVAVGFFPRLRVVLALLVVAAVGYELHPVIFEARAFTRASMRTAVPMVLEAQWDQPNVPVRKAITAYLRANYDGTPIMASMGSLGHYMQEASRDGFAIRDFLHEGNGDLWLAALDGPRPFVGWILIEEKANGGDVLAKKVRENPRFLEGFSRVGEGAGLALYKRQNLKPTVNM